MPLFLHQLQHAIVTAPSGARPKPLSDSSPEMRAVPVLCEIQGEGGLTVQVAGFEFQRFEFQGQKVSRLLLRVVLPEGHRIVTDATTDQENPPPIQTEPLRGEFTIPETVPVPWKTTPPGAPIPELAIYDPEVFRANTDKPAGATASGNGTGERVPNSGDAKHGT